MKREYITPTIKIKMFTESNLLANSASVINAINSDTYKAAQAELMNNQKVAAEQVLSMYYKVD